MGNEITLPSNTTLDRGAVDRVLRQRGSRAESWDLIPRAELPPIIAGLDEATHPANMDQAKRAAEVLLGSYPRHAVDDPEIYSRGIVSVLNRFPSHVGAKAVDNLTLKSKFLPTRAELNEQCEAIMGEINAARAIARRMVEEHDRRENEQREQAEREASRKAFRDKHGDKTPLEVLAADGIFTKGTTDRKDDQ